MIIQLSSATVGIPTGVDPILNDTGCVLILSRNALSFYLNPSVDVSPPCLMPLPSFMILDS